MSVYSIVKEEKNKIILDFFVCESFLQFFSQYYIGRIIDWRKIMEEFGYCKNCNEYVPCTIRNKVHIEWYMGEKICLRYRTGICKHCDSEVATDSEYYIKKEQYKSEIDKRLKGIITLSQTNEILRKYNIGKEALSIVAGFGKVTVKRYYEGVMPCSANSEILMSFLNDESFFLDCVEKHKSKLTNLAYRKICKRYHELSSIRDSKIYQIANYILTHVGKITPTTLECLLFFSSGVNYALNRKQLIPDECQVSLNGPIYPIIHNMYNKPDYILLDNGIASQSGWLMSKISLDERRAIDLTLRTFGIYSPKILEMVSRNQLLYITNLSIDQEAAVEAYYASHNLNTEENITNYIFEVIKNNQ